MSRKKHPNKSEMLEGLLRDTGANDQGGEEFSRYEIPPEMSQSTSLEEKRAAEMRSIKSTRVIRLKGGKLVQLTSIYLPADVVADVTYVHPDNIRGVTGVNPHTVEDILCTIKSGGVQAEVLAVRMEDTRYAIFDGQRRQFCAILTGQGLPLAYVDASEQLSRAELREWSRIANMVMPNSLYDKGVYFETTMREKGWKPDEISKVAEYCGTSKADVSYSLKAIKIPMEIFRLLPTGTSTGRPTVLRLVGLFQELTAGQMTSLKSWAAESEPYENPQKCLSDIAAQVRKLTGEPIKEKPKSNNFGGIEVIEKRPGRFELTLPVGISAEDLYAALQLISQPENGR